MNARRAPKAPPFAVGTKLRYIGKHVIHTAFGGGPGTMILGPGLEVVIDRVVAGRRGTGEPLRDEDGPMVDDDGEPYIDKTKDGYSVYSITDATSRKRSGRCIHADSAHEWEVIVKMSMGERMIYAAEFVRSLAADGPAKAATSAWGAVMTFRYATVGLQGDHDDPNVRAMWADMVSGQNDGDS